MPGNNDLVRIPSVLMRGGTSRGPFFLRSDLPADAAARDAVLIAAMGAGHELQVDGIGGGHPLTAFCGAISVGVVDGTPVLDLPYSEDSRAEVDMNVVMTSDGRFVEGQGTAEGKRQR